MASFSKRLKELFSFTRNERIAVVVLFVILMTVFLYPYFAQKPDIDETGFEDFKLLVDEFENSKTESNNTETAIKPKNSSQQTQAKQIETFEFDPNTADENIFVRLGFSQKQAAAIINYRNKGGKFTTADDFKKVYVVDDKNFNRLKSYINIKLPANKSPQNEEKPNSSIQNNTSTIRTVFVEINSADTTELKKLRGIGSYYARLIVDHRSKLGGFTDINQLKEIRQMDDERISMFSNQVKIDTVFINKFNINKLTSKELAQHPYISTHTARGIEQYRNFAGKIENLQQLVKENILTAEQSDKLKYYVEF
ncbi:MAG: helix-hairpin-helix domain-containing protein [Prevotellaceae bacterium]|jgi:DNA uptake protein ComE-like DNA-binding protein|nr:helix-hairpin-helix domain-containing protein [Prevotellaceae bacterium]